MTYPGNRRVRPPPTVFCAFHEHWHASAVQLAPVLEKKGLGSEPHKLVRDAAEDGVFSAHVARYVIGRMAIQVA